jgi:hypothetical protein
MKRNTTEKEKKIFKYLNDLRESGKTNMFGAAPYLVRKFKMERDNAIKYLKSWMHNFDENGVYDEIDVDENVIV